MCALLPSDERCEQAHAGAKNSVGIRWASSERKHTFPPSAILPFDAKPRLRTTVHNISVPIPLLYLLPPSPLPPFPDPPPPPSSCAASPLRHLIRFTLRRCPHHAFLNALDNPPHDLPCVLSPPLSRFNMGAAAAVQGRHHRRLQHSWKFHRKCSAGLYLHFFPVPRFYLTAVHRCSWEQKPASTSSTRQRITQPKLMAILLGLLVSLAYISSRFTVR